nr:hypothetical protein MFLOJ_34110 [Mycobacterium florentinum]
MLLNVVSGSDDAEPRRFGDYPGHDERYARTAEFLRIVRPVWTQDSVNFTGKYYTVEDARVSAPPNPLPGIYFGGSSGAALLIAAEFADVYLTWGEPPQAAAAKIEKVRARRLPRGAAGSGSASGCTPSAATPRPPPGPLPMICSPTSPTIRSRKPQRCMLVRNP